MKGRYLGFSVSLMIAGMMTGIPTATAATVHVHIQGSAFVPNALTINVGDAVNWDNHDGIPHTTTDLNCPRANGPGPCEWDSFNLGLGQSFSHAFAAGGLFEYECTIHHFTGTITVLNPNGQADLRVSAITFSDPPAPNGLTQKRITATVVNDGTSGTFARPDLVVSYFYQGDWHTISQWDVGLLPKGASRSFTVVWDTTAKIGDFTIRGVVDTQNAVAELDETNNERTAVVSLLTPPGLVPGTDLKDPI